MCHLERALDVQLGRSFCWERVHSRKRRGIVPKQRFTSEPPTAVRNLEVLGDEISAKEWVHLVGTLGWIEASCLRQR